MRRVGSGPGRVEYRELLERMGQGGREGGTRRSFCPAFSLYVLPFPLHIISPLLHIWAGRPRRDPGRR